MSVFAQTQIRVHAHAQIIQVLRIGYSEATEMHGALQYIPSVLFLDVHVNNTANKRALLRWKHEKTLLIINPLQMTRDEHDSEMSLLLRAKWVRTKMQKWT